MDSLEKPNEEVAVPEAQLMVAPAPLVNGSIDFASFERNKYQTVTISAPCPFVAEMDPSIYTKSCKKPEHSKKVKKSVPTHVLTVIPQTHDGQGVQPCGKCKKFLEVTELKQKDKERFEKHCDRCKSHDQCHYHFALRIVCGHGNLANDLWLKCELKEKSVNTVNISLEPRKVTFSATRGTKPKPMEKHLKFISFSVTRFLSRFSRVLSDW